MHKTIITKFVNEKITEIKFVGPALKKNIMLLSAYKLHNLD